MFLAASSSNRSGVVEFEIDEFAVFPLPHLRSFRNNVGINCTLAYDDTSFWISAGVNKDDLE